MRQVVGSIPTQGNKIFNFHSFAVASRRSAALSSTLQAMPPKVGNRIVKMRLKCLLLALGSNVPSAYPDMGEIQLEAIKKYFLNFNIFYLVGYN